MGNRREKQVKITVLAFFGEYPKRLQSVQICPLVMFFGAKV
ncbi:hypothetical protein HMPREF9078_02087 [Capnocytophaga sp. oral taxon 380 str. F0488]|nr:hypothetical protein HMPREF9078_02087 [Capnocytophaga sp. oral taxon 380 str. F0488]